MADLLRAGAAMLAERCPICGLPLFRLRSGEVVCPLHGRVYIVRDESEASKVTVKGVLEELERVAAQRIAEAVRDLRGLGVESIGVIRDWLEIIERAERILSIIDAGRQGSGEKQARREGRDKGVGG
ncbi:MAG: hypothetical protein DSY37_03700 [Hyperthermus sp.]|nr:MAG: hypothetical protein DSY37_03700 [Hyperthermus sp.]